MNGIDWLKRTLVTALAVVLCALLVACGGTSSGTSDEQAIMGLLDDVFTGITEASDAEVDEAFGEDAVAILEGYGIAPKDVWDAAFSRLTYQIDDVTIDSDTATAQVTVSNVDFDKVIGELETYMASDEAAGLETGVVFEQFLDVLEDKDLEMSEQTVEVTFQKSEEDGWVMTSDGREVLFTAIYGGSTLEMEDASADETDVTETPEDERPTVEDATEGTDDAD